MEKKIKILAVNPGSTSTKIGVFENETQVFSKNIAHDAKKLKVFGEIQDQLSYRKEIIEAELGSAKILLGDIDIYVGRGGGLLSLKGGTYKVTEKLLEDASVAKAGAPHPAQLASQICAMYVEEYGGKAFIVNPPDVDEYCDLARITGFSDIYRSSHVHALNQKEVAMRYCKSKGKKYEDINLIVCHIGGGISIAAHEKGNMIDANDLLGGEGPMMPTRSGSLPAIPLVKMCFSGKYLEEEIINRINKTGGLIDHLGINNAIEIETRIDSGDKHAKLVYDGMIYQIAKSVGACAAILKGEVEGILCTGGISNSKYVTSSLKEYLQWISPVTVIAGDFELEALAAGALRVVNGEEDALIYSGKPAWRGFLYNQISNA